MSKFPRKYLNFCSVKLNTEYYEKSKICVSILQVTEAIGDKSTGSFEFINSCAAPANQLNPACDPKHFYFRPCQLIRIYKRTIYLVGPKAMHYHNSTPYFPVHMPWVLVLKLHPNGSVRFPLENRGQSYANGRVSQK